MLNFRLRESLGGGIKARHTWVPRNRGLTPCLTPAIPWASNTGLHWPLGVPWLWCPGKIVPKLCFPGPVPGKLLGVKMRNGGAGGEVLGNMLVSCLCTLTQAEAKMEHARSLLRISLGYGLGLTEKG